MATANATVNIQYGLAYVSVNSVNGQEGDDVLLYSCYGSCYDVGSEIDWFDNGITRLGKLDRAKKLSGIYVNVTEDIINGKNLFIIIAHESLDDDGNTVGYESVERFEVEIGTIDTDYQMILTTDESGGLDISNGLVINVTRDGENPAFKDSSRFSYKINLYLVPSNTVVVGPENTPDEWDRHKDGGYLPGDTVIYNGKYYVCVKSFGPQSESPGLTARGEWAECNRCGYPYIMIDGQRLINTTTLKNTPNTTIIDAVTNFKPNSDYKYILTIRAEQPINAANISDEWVCCVSEGSTASCLLFDPSVGNTGELCVVDEENNIVSVQNAEAGQSYPRPEQEKNNDWITFGIMPTDSRCLNIVAFEGDEAARANFVDWMESDGGCLEYAYLGYADIPNEIQNYNPVISGTVQMHLDKVNDISYNLNLPETVYTGSPIEIPSEGYGVTNLSDPGIVVQYALKDPETGEYGEYSSNISIGPDVGTYGIKVKLSLENYAETEAEGELQIMPAEITGITISGWEGDYVAGESRAITLEGCQDDDVITYSEDTETYQEEAFSYSDVGTYTVYVNISRPNYNDWRGSASITINPISITGITITGFRGADDGQPHSIAIDGVLDSDTVLYSTDGITYDLIANPEFSGVGSHTVYVKVTRDNHNDWYANAVVDITEKPTFTITISGYEGRFDGEEHGITLGETEVGDIISYSNDGSVYVLSESPKYAAVGTYEVYVKVERAGYEDWVGHAFINITPANINDVTITGYSGTYDGSSHGITVTSRGGDSIGYSTDGSTYTSTNPEFTNAGEYVVYVKVEREGYNDFTGSGTVNIAKKTATLTFEADDRDYDGTTTANITGYTFSGLVDGETASVTGYVGAFEDKNAGEDKEVTVSGYTISGINLDNYNIEIASVYATIAQIALTVTFTVSNKTYNASNNATVTNTSVVGKIDGDVVNTGNVTATFADANVGNDKEVTITYNLSGSDAINYSYESPVSTRANITPATITGIRAVDGGGVYTGSPYQISVSGRQTGDTILYSTDGETYSATNPSFTEIGTYTVYVKVSRANYNDWTGQADVVITPEPVADITYSLEQNGRPSTGDGSVADDRHAIETTALEIRLSSVPSTDLSLSNISKVTGSAYFDLVSLTKDDSDAAHYTLAIQRTGTASTGQDSIGIKINADGITDAEETILTHMPTVYWGAYPLTIEQDDAYYDDDPDNDFVLTINRFKDNSHGYILTGAKTTPLQLTFRRISGSACDIDYFITLWGTVSNPYNGTLSPRWDDFNEDSYKGKLSPCGAVSANGASYNFDIT